MKNLTILVIGGTGFIGSNLVIGLQKLGYYVIVFSRGHPSVLGKIKNVEYVVGNISNHGEIDEVLDKVDYVFHFASSTNPKSSENDLIFDLTSNLISSIHIMESCVRNNIKKLIYCSSGGTVYGIHDQMPLTESSICEPISSYGLVKFGIENYLKYFNYKYNLDYEILRLSNPYGIGQSYAGNQGIIAIFIDRILNGDEIQVFGNGSIIRDYIYIDDFVSLCIKLLVTRKKNNILNVGSGNGTSISDIINGIEEITKVKAKIKYLAERKFDVPEIYLDINKAKDIYDWEPKVELHEGLIKTIQWIKEKKIDHE